jgi:hypothetical protein
MGPKQDRRTCKGVAFARQDATVTGSKCIVANDNSYIASRMLVTFVWMDNPRAKRLTNACQA